MYDANSAEVLHAASVLMLAIAAEDGNVDQREVTSASEALAGWGRTDRVTAAQHVQGAFQELGQVWQTGGHAELERHLWHHAGLLASSLEWAPLNDLVQILKRVADADGKLERAELGLIEALASYFDREAGPPDNLDAAALLANFDADSRGPRWIERFQDRVRGAMLEVGDPNARDIANPRMVDGPGGVRLAEARLQPVGGLEVGFLDLARWCTDEGVGLMIEPTWTDPPGYAFRYGELWSFRAFEGSFDGPAALGRQPTLEELLPTWAREQLARLFERYGVPGRQLAHLTSPAGEPALAFDAPASYLPDPGRHDALERDLRFMSPPGTVFLTVDPAAHPDFPFQAL